MSKRYASHRRPVSKTTSTAKSKITATPNPKAHSTNRNLGATSLRRKRRPGDPMQSYDALPAPLRNWLSQAALPWSPASAQRIWDRANAQGCSVTDALTALSRVEQKTLARDHHAQVSNS
ncbi:MAG: DUF6525 family protein [Paracoccaceae bacterium]